VDLARENYQPTQRQDRKHGGNFDIGDFFLNLESSLSLPDWIRLFNHVLDLTSWGGCAARIYSQPQLPGVLWKVPGAEPELVV
jgi:hypothetical protein